MSDTTNHDRRAAVRAEVKNDLIELAVGKIHPGSTKGRHTTGVYDIPMLTDYIMEKMDAECLAVLDGLIERKSRAGSFIPVAEVIQVTAIRAVRADIARGRQQQ